MIGSTADQRKELAGAGLAVAAVAWNAQDLLVIDKDRSAFDGGGIDPNKRVAWRTLC